MTMKISINTIQELIDHGFTVDIYCHNPRCHHRAELDLKQLRDRLGPDQSLLVDDIKHKLRCGKCGGKEFEVLIARCVEQIARARSRLLTQHSSCWPTLFGRARSRVPQHSSTLRGPFGTHGGPLLCFRNAACRGSDQEQIAAVGGGGDQLFKVFERLGAGPELLIILDSYGFAQPDEWVLEQLRLWNAERRTETGL